MEIFYSNDCDGDVCRLDAEESNHCLRVLRHRIGDEIFVVDGKGTLYRCLIAGDAPREVVARVAETLPEWGGHAYSLNMAVCPTKNNERFEWFVEKATELGVDVISPVLGERSERRVFKTDRSRKVALSAMKQSLKAKLPIIEEPVSVRDFILAHGLPGISADAAAPESAADDSRNGATSFVPGSDSVPLASASGDGVLRLIAYCFEGDVPRQSIVDVLRASAPSDTSAPSAHSAPSARQAGGQLKLIVLIGPEGDFSPEEARLAVLHGFIPVHLGLSRLRTETAAVTAVAACYLAAQGWHQSTTLVQSQR